MVLLERINPSGRVLLTDRVAVERLHASGGVEHTGGLAKERAKTLTAVVGALVLRNTPENG